MERHFVQQIEQLKSEIIRMGSVAEQMVDGALRAFLDRSPEAAESVFRQEHQVNAYEIGIDNEVADMLALHQPVARDLRFLLAAMKINNDLERIGDHAVNIAESAVAYARRPELTIPADIPQMAQITREMLRVVLDGFIHGNPEECRVVLRSDDSIDDLNRKIARDVITIIKSNPDAVEQAFDLVRVSRNLERIGDLATNIAEEVIYYLEAQVVKHQGDRGAATA
ncbi:MAG: phosphate uptake regulator [Bacteroidetes bacterium]|nr:phosphate uptake regulator [Bacteroidota bacterium]